MHSKRSELTIVEPVPLGTTRARMKETRGVADATPGPAFYILLTSKSREPIRLPKHMAMAHAMDPPNTIATTGISLIDCEANNSRDMLGRSRQMNQTSDGTEVQEKETKYIL